jgi:hypothetical protein
MMSLESNLSICGLVPAAMFEALMMREYEQGTRD